MYILGNHKILLVKILWAIFEMKAHKRSFVNPLKRLLKLHVVVVFVFNVHQHLRSSGDGATA